MNNSWRVLDMLLINFQINHILTWSANCFITNSTGAGTFTITNAKLYVPVATLSNLDSNEQLIGINIKQRYQRRHKTSVWITFLIRVLKEPTYLLFYCLKIMRSEQDTEYFPLKVEIKNYNIMIGVQDFLTS